MHKSSVCKKFKENLKKNRLEKLKINNILKNGKHNEYLNEEDNKDQQAIEKFSRIGQYLVKRIIKDVFSGLRKVKSENPLKLP